MSFYGNVVNNNNRQFTFDRIYPNKQAMDDRIQADDIFVGRFVLIDYNEGDIFEKYYKQFYSDDNGKSFYYFNGTEKESVILIDETYYQENTTIVNLDCFKDEYKNSLFINEPFYIKKENNIYEFYKYNTKKEFELIHASSEKDGVYSINFWIDGFEFNNIKDGRPWDSTVWQKISYGTTEKYVMVAELNSAVPEIELYVDAPTLTPEEPYFDVNSTDKKYNLHIQPAWGFRVAEASDTEPSDVDVKSELVKWDEDSKSIAHITEGYKGDIYFNKAGFSSEKSIKSEADDIISITPSGMSGREYSNENGGKSRKNDTFELSVHLPSIGNAVAQLWDIVYGPGVGEAKQRNTNIDWNNISGLRLASLSSDGNGYDYNTNAVKTLAGCINSIHDLMGMIIIDESANSGFSINNALSNYIYYTSDKKYKIKNLTYNYAPVPSDEELKKINNMIEFSAENTYYKGNDNYYKADKYSFGNNYYKIASELIEKVENLTSETWKPNTYYYKENNSYILDTEGTPNLNYEYYKLNIKDLNSIKKVNNEITIFHPALYTKETLNKLFPTEKFFNKDGQQIGGNGLFYKLINEEGEYFVLYDIENPPDKSTVDTLQNWRYYKNYKVEVSTNLYGQPVLTYEFNGNDTNFTELQIIQFEQGAFYYLNDQNQYINLTSVEEVEFLLNQDDASQPGKPQTYWKLVDENITSFELIDGKFYQANQYYYLDGANYIFAKENNKVKDTYYIINEDAIISYPPQGDTIYEPNKYQYKNDNNEWVVDDKSTMTAGANEYQINTKIRYNPDTGEILNQNISDEEYKKLNIIPNYRTEVYKWKELEGFAHTLNTIHGLILHIHNTLKTGDAKTRDLNTVQGCINQMNDIINKIESLIPNQLIAVNEYGKMTSMELAGDDTWISTSVNAEKSNEIKISHQNSKLDPDTYKPGNTASLNFGDQLKILAYTTDAAGHLVGSEVETVTLPVGSVNDAQPSGADVITHLNFIEKTGALSTTRTNIATLKLTEYSKGSANADIEAGDTLGSALSKLQTQIIDEENARSAAITAEQKARTEAIQKEQTDRETAINTAIQSLDSEKTQAEGTDGLALRLKIVDGKIESFSGSIKANTYVKKSEATGYDDILTKTAAGGLYQPKGEYATKQQGEKADSTSKSLEELTNTVNGLIDRIAALEAALKAPEENPS